MKKQRPRPAKRKQPVKDSGQTAKPESPVMVVCSGAVPRFDPPELLRLVVERGREEGQAGRPGGFYRFAHDVLIAPRVPEPWPRAMLNYNVVDYAPLMQCSSDGSPSAGLSVGQG